MFRVLFLCTHNSARSQMAEALLRELGDGQVEAFSAGTFATSVRPEAVKVMKEEGIDVSGQESKSLERFLGDRFDEVVTVCDDANQTCPVFLGASHQRHWPIPDPSSVEGSNAERLIAFRQARDELRRRIEEELVPLISPVGMPGLG